VAKQWRLQKQRLKSRLNQTRITLQAFKEHSNFSSYQQKKESKLWLKEILSADADYIAVLAQSTEPTKTMRNT
jgi:hypothetical protein